MAGLVQEKGGLSHRLKRVVQNMGDRQATKKIPAMFFGVASGDEPVRDWLKALDKIDRQSIGEDTAYVQYKWPIGKSHIDHLRGPIQEVRSKIGNQSLAT